MTASPTSTIETTNKRKLLMPRPSIARLSDACQKLGKLMVRNIRYIPVDGKWIVFYKTDTGNSWMSGELSLKDLITFVETYHQAYDEGYKDAHAEYAR